MSSEKDSRTQRAVERISRNTNSNDPKMMSARVFIGNLAADKLSRQDIMKMFEPHGKVLGISIHRSYGFVQFDTEDEAKEAVKATDGKVLEGLKIDVYLANERRKETGPERPPPPRVGRGGRRDHHRSPSPRPLRRRYDSDRFPPHPRHWGERERMGWRGGSPPHVGAGGGGMPHHYDRERDFDRYPLHHHHMRGEPYGRPRDDPYERYPPPPLPLPRDRERYVPPRDFYDTPRRDGYAPHERYPYDYPPPRGRGSPPVAGHDRVGPSERERYYEEWDREKRIVTINKPESGAEGGGGGGGGGGRTVDMEIIVINRQQREYASLVATRVRDLGLVVQTQQLSPTVSLADALDSAAQQGLLYALIITSQHEHHRSVTLTILHGRNPQEHKNMPLDDAVGLVAKDFEHFSNSSRSGAAAVPGRRQGPAPIANVSHLLGKAASGANLSSFEINTVISALQKQKQGDDSLLPSSSSHHASLNEVEVANTTAAVTTTEDIQRQQADLQAKILSLLGSSAVVPPPSTATSPPSNTTTTSKLGEYESAQTQTRGGTSGYPNPSGFRDSSQGGYGSGYTDRAQSGGPPAFRGGYDDGY